MRSSGTPVIYLIGTSGHPNYGDELITAAWLGRYARKFPNAVVYLDSPFPGRSASLFRGLHPHLRCVDTLYHACWNAPLDSPEATVNFGYEVAGAPGMLPREATAVEDFADIDLVHILGGGYINAVWPSHLALIGAAATMADRFGARTAMTGAGLIPLVENDSETLGQWLARFDVVDARDSGTFEAVSRSVPQATQLGDDALLSLVSSPNEGLVPGWPVEGGTPTMLNLQSDLLTMPLEQLVDCAVATLKAWGVDQEPITLVECLPPDDLAALPLLEPHLPQLQVLRFAEVWRDGLPVHVGQRWITTRFHLHLVAAAAGAWGVAVPVSDEYYRPKHDSLIALGSGWAVANSLEQPATAGTAPDQPFSGNLPTLVDGKRQLCETVLGLVTAEKVVAAPA